MLNDYLSRRQNVVHRPNAELNAKLKAIADTFGETWLQADDGHPLQELWKRQDALSTNELLNFGDAVERWEKADQGWLDNQAKLVKLGDVGQQAGAIFEIIGLNLFTEEFCQVIPAPDSMPGFDGTLILKDGSRVVVSIKNHGVSTREREFQDEAKRLDEEFKDVKKVGRELGVRYVLEGSVRRSGARVRITGQLVDAATGTNIWAERFEGSVANVFDLQDQITENVVGAIAPQLERAEIERAKRKPTESLQAYDHYLRGMAKLHTGTREALNEALPSFLKAIELDPEYASAYGMGMVLFLAAGQRVDV